MALKDSLTGFGFLSVVVMLDLLDAKAKADREGWRGMVMEAGLR